MHVQKGNILGNILAGKEIAGEALSADIVIPKNEAYSRMGARALSAGLSARPPPPKGHSVQDRSTALLRAVSYALCCTAAGAAPALARFVSARAIAVGAVAHALPAEQTTFELVLCEKDKGKPTTLLVQVGGRAERDR